MPDRVTVHVTDPGAAVRQGFALVCVVAVAIAAAVFQPQPAAAETASARADQQRGDRPPLDELLNRLPIGTERMRAIQPSTSGANQARTLAEPGSRETGRALWVVLVAVAGALVLLTAFRATAFEWRRGRRSESVSLSTSTLALFHHALAQATERSPRVAELPNDQHHPQPTAEASESEQQPEAAGSEGDGPGLTLGHTPAPMHRGDYDGVGKHVIGVLEAAEIAGAQIRAEATDKAAEIREAAEAEAEGYLQKAEQEAAEVRSAAEASAAETRSAAEELAASRLEEAEEKAEAIRLAAEERVRELELAARERHGLLRDQLQPLEENLRRALQAFRGISGELEELLEAQPMLAQKSLVEVLNESTRQAEDRSPEAGAPGNEQGASRK
jgi:hypothetical protein